MIKKIMGLISAMGLSLAGFLGFMGVPYTLSGTVATDIGSTFTDLGESFLINFVKILQLAIPLIVIYAIIKMVKVYTGR